MYLYHYFNKENGSFLSMSDLPEEEARKVLDSMSSYLAEKNGWEYTPDQVEAIFNTHKLRRLMESELRQKFAEKGGKILRKSPYDI